MEGWRLSFSVSISPNSLCLSFGTWSIEAGYQSAAKQKFKAAFDVRDYGEQGVMVRARWDMQGTGLEVEKRYPGASTVCQGLSWVLVNRTTCSSPWGLPESLRKE